MLSESFDQYVGKVVEYHQFKYELGLSDDEAQEHPDTLGVFGQLVQLVEVSPEIINVYTAAANRENENHAAAINRVREIETEIALIRRDCGVISSREYQGAIRKLVKKAGVVAKAQEFMGIFVEKTNETPLEETQSDQQEPEETIEPDELLDHFLFNPNQTKSPEPQIQELFDPTHFYQLVTKGVDLDAASIETAMRRFVEFSPVKDPEEANAATDEEVVSAHLQTIDSGLAKFIESGTRYATILMSDVEIRILQSFYSRTNLLLHARSLIEQSNALTHEQVDQIYRYRVVVKMLEDARVNFEKVKQEPPETTRARLWRGNVRDYGSDVGGRICAADYIQFSDEHREPVPHAAKAGDELVPLTKLQRHD